MRRLLVTSSIGCLLIVTSLAAATVPRQAASPHSRVLSEAVMPVQAERVCVVALGGITLNARTEFPVAESGGALMRGNLVYTANENKERQFFSDEEHVVSADHDSRGMALLLPSPPLEQPRVELQSELRCTGVGSRQ